MKSRIASAVVAIAALGLLSAAPAAGQATHKIVGGAGTTIGAHPWQIAILRDDNGAFYCGGSLIRPRVVLTAAHCLVGGGGVTSPFTPPADDFIVAGATDWNDPAQGIEVPIIGSVVHPGYNVAAGSDGGNDVALLILQDPVPANFGQTIKLAGPDERSLWRQGDGAAVTGWGANAEGVPPSSSLLMQANVPIVSDTNCSFSYGGAFIASLMVCAGFDAGGIDACQGDSGGPLTVPAFGGDGGLIRLAGVVSFGFGCARPAFYGVYARIGQDPLQAFVQNAVNASVDPGDVIGNGGGRCATIVGKSRKKRKARAICFCQEDKFGKARKKCVKKVKRKFSRRK